MLSQEQLKDGIQCKAKQPEYKVKIDIYNDGKFSIHGSNWQFSIFFHSSKISHLLVMFNRCFDDSNAHSHLFYSEKLYYSSESGDTVKREFIAHHSYECRDQAQRRYYPYKYM